MCLSVERKRVYVEIESKRDGESVFMCSEIERSRWRERVCVCVVR